MPGSHYLEFSRLEGLKNGGRAGKVRKRVLLRSGRDLDEGTNRELGA